MVTNKSCLLETCAYKLSFLSHRRDYVSTVLRKKMETVKSDEYVVVKRVSHMSLHQLPKREGKPWAIKVGRDKVNLSSVIGKPYGAFKIINKKGAADLEPAESVVELKKELLKNVQSGESNQKIWDDGTSQTLKKDDIEELREKGVTGTEIVSQLLENSKSFQIKTEFSQEKYVNKKEEKYSEWVEILKPNLRLLSKVYHQQDPTKILNLRPDMLSMILSFANIKANGVYGIFDGGCQGLIDAAVLDRIQGLGTLWNLFLDQSAPQKQVVKAMNFSPIQLKPLQYCPISKLNRPIDETEETPAKMRRLDLPGRNSLDSLIIASRSPNNIKQLIKLVKPSGNFVIYCPHIEAINETYAALRDANYAINLKLIEAWLRNYQVLPHRTHPEVMMSGTGGYILSGIRVVP